MRQIKDINEALMAKLGWNFLSNNNTTFVGPAVKEQIHEGR